MYTPLEKFRRGERQFKPASPFWDVFIVLTLKTPNNKLRTIKETQPIATGQETQHTLQHKPSLKGNKYILIQAVWD